MKLKKVLCLLAMLCAVVQGAKAQANWNEVYAMTNTTTADWIQLNAGSTTGQTIGASGTTTYYYAGADLTFTNSTYGGSGLTIQGTVYLYVPEGVTVTCKGTSGLRRTIGSGAGIELTEGNTLYLIGTGTVNAEGGLASGGETGNDGGDAGWDTKNYWSGTGGRGGNGGGGAGAGIGTRGGDGGMGADGAASVVSKWDHAGGGSGVAGIAGATAGAMGKLYVAQSFIHLTATGGSAGWMYGSGSAGSAGKSILDDDETYNYCAAGGGGGGGGGYGGAAAGIGTGGPGGGGSGGGASGNLEWCNSGYYVVRAPGGKGGQNGDGTWAADGEESILNYENLNNGQAYSNSSGWSNNDDYISSQAVGTEGSGGAAGAASISVNSQVISVVTSETTTMNSGYYYVLGDVTVAERITVNGNVTLNLDKGATLNAPKGIELSLGNSLTINGPGALNIDGVAKSQAGIGAKAMGALTINGGQLTITGGNGASAIGSDRGAGSGTLTLGWNAETDFIACRSYAVESITFAPGKTFYLDGTKTIATPDNMSGKKLVPFDGYVTSESTTLTTGEYEVNADVTMPERITISGDVVLHLGEEATLTAPKGIELSEGNSLTINGPGVLTIDDVANSKSGIGAAAVGTLTINGGTINVKGGEYGAALGGDCDNSVGGSITINGGIVHATGGENAAGIGGGKNTKDGKYGVCGDITIHGGKVTANGGVDAPGIGPGYDSATLCNSGTLTLGWTNEDDFIYINSLKNYQNYTLESITFVPGKMFYLGGTETVATSDNIAGNKLVPDLRGYVTCESTILTTDEYKVSGEVTISNRITISGDVVLQLGEGATLNVPKGIELSQGNSLTINGSGALTIDGCDENKSGIGAYSVGSLIINGGTINVKGGMYGAALGGDCNNNVGGSIIINGGAVHATGGEYAAAIGGGFDNGAGNYGVCGDITINGGQVTAIGGKEAPGAGPGYESSDTKYYNSGTLTLGWTSKSDFIYFSSTKNNQESTLESIDFVNGKSLYTAAMGRPVWSTVISGVKLLPYFSGKCGDGLTWFMTDDDCNGSFETLNIKLTSFEGNDFGRMTNYPDGVAAPWYADFHNDITSISFDGVHHIGSNAFRGLTALVETTVPMEITSIGSGAYADCSNLTRVNLNKVIENPILKLDSPIFQNCDALTAIAVSSPEVFAWYYIYWGMYNSKLRVTLGYDYLFEGGGETNDSYIKIATADDLHRLAEAVNAGNATARKNFRQTADIDLAGADFPGIGWRNGNESFQGTYDGCGHTISGLNVSSSHDCAGLFGHVSNGATFRNITLVQPSVTTTAHTADPIRVGAVAGYASSVQMENCHVLQPTLSATGSGTQHIGAIVGEISETGNKLANCFYYQAGELGGIGNDLGTENTIDNVVPVYGIDLDQASVALPGELYANGDASTGTILEKNGFTVAGTTYLRDQLQFTPTVKIADPGVSGYAVRLLLDGQVLEPDEGATSPAQVTVTVCADNDGKTLSATILSNGQPQEVTFVDAHGQQHTAQAIPLDGHEEGINNGVGSINLAAGTYFVGIDLDYTGVTIHPMGDVTLILCNGRTMRFGTDSNPSPVSAVHEPTSWSRIDNLTIYGQSLDAATAGTLSYVGTAQYAFLLNRYTQHSGNVNIKNTPRSTGRGISTRNCLTMSGGTLTIDTRSESTDVEAVLAGDSIIVTGGQLTANATGTSYYFGLATIWSWSKIKLGWTNPDDFICANGFDSSGTITTALAPGTDTYQYLTPDDGTTTLSGPLDAKLDSCTLRPYWAGQGTDSDPYLISSTSELDLLAYRVNGTHGVPEREDGYVGCYFRLTKDLAYPYTTRWDDTTSRENNYEPIGDDWNDFRGDFDGGGHTVSGIRIYVCAYGAEIGVNLGLFGSVLREANVHDVIISDANITGYANVGGIVGFNYGLINRCHVTNTVAIYSGVFGSKFGGIAGYVEYYGAVTNCTSAAYIGLREDATMNCAGGISGKNVGYIADNLAFGVTIPTSYRGNYHGAISGDGYWNSKCKNANNYYSASNVAGVPNATEVGTCPKDSSYDPTRDIPDNDAYVSLLRDLADNTAAIEHVAALSTILPGNRPLDLGWGPGRFPFQLAGRTLYKDGSWNTLCLPFAVAIEDSPLEDATIMMLDNSTDSRTGFDAATGTLHLDFVEATSIEPGVAYLVKWNRATDYVDDDAHNIVNPVFYGAAVSAEAPAGKRTESADGKVAFTGTYAAVAYDKDTPGVLFLGADNKLYYPKSGASIGAFRAMFRLNGITAGEPKDGEQGIKAFALDFGNENSTLVSLPSEMEEADAWYDLSGRRLEGKPSQRGIYVTRGRKVVIK